ncbi:hypothetical protein Vadar_020586 [Vaccinium darrowii]|uniref:Uncharacterized protein n=1 Tax=Vaccinium darrowii TaxID=229202 RepID=A0ACB7YN67_9ERIC|nr:hypothetical protein Vadar_020586 [Vaccinium darrowii]
MMIRNLLQHPEFPAFRQGWVPEDIRETFFKCTRWQLEETMDPINCPYHYFCDSTNPAEKNDIKYAFYSASTISGILHASLYLDSTILPFYTGFDALVSSTFSVVGTICVSTICRLSKEYERAAKLIKTVLENLALSGLFVLICLHVIRKACTWLKEWNSRLIIFIVKRGPHSCKWNRKIVWDNG